MKLRAKDKVLVVTGRDKGKKGEIIAVLPKTKQVVVENINTVKKHTKPSQKQPKGGIIEITKPIDASKVMAIDPVSGKPARIGYKIDAKGNKERVYKVSTFVNKKSNPKKVEKNNKPNDKKQSNKQKNEKK